MVALSKSLIIITWGKKVFMISIYQIYFHSWIMKGFSFTEAHDYPYTHFWTELVFFTKKKKKKKRERERETSVEKCEND